MHEKGTAKCNLYSGIFPSKQNMQSAQNQSVPKGEYQNKMSNSLQNLSGETITRRYSSVGQKLSGTL